MRGWGVHECACVHDVAALTFAFHHRPSLCIHVTHSSLTYITPPRPLPHRSATLGDALAARVTQGSHPHPTSRPPPPLPNTPNTPTLAPTSVPENAPPAAQAVAEGQALSARGALLVNCAVPLRQALRQAGCLKRWEGEVAAMEERGGAEAVEGEVMGMGGVGVLCGVG